MSIKEIWIDIIGYEGLYLVSNTGKVKSVDRFVDKGEKGLSYRKGILLSINKSTPYPRVSLCKNGVLKYFLVHRLVAESFIPNPKSKPEVNHIDFNKNNNNVNNLEWVTSKENTNHAIVNGVMPKPKKGEHVKTSKLKNNQIIEIRKSKESCKKLGEKYGVGAMCINRIKRGITWRHI